MKEAAEKTASLKHQEMKLNWLTLAFPGELEGKFREDYYHTSIGLMRLSFILGFIYYGSFSFLDMAVFDEVTSQLAFVRFLFVCPVILIIFGLSFTRHFRKWWQAGAALTTMVSGAGIVVMTVITPSLGRINYYPGIMLVLFYCYMLIRLRFVWATLTGWFIFLVYIASVILYPGVQSEVVMINVVFIASANILGMFGGYALEYYARRDFFSRYLLDRERSKVEKANLELEGKVREKTKQLQQAQKMESFGSLAGGVAHDFNNLLTIINGYSDLGLQEAEGMDSSLYNHFTQIHNAGQKAASLTRQLLAFSRKQVLEQKIVDLASLMKDLYKMLDRLIGEDYTLLVSVPETSLISRVDPGQIEQVLMNLVINARDASPSGATIHMSGSITTITPDDKKDMGKGEPGKYVLLKVRDNGTGMDEKTLERIFEPFFTTKKAGTGTGLGLSVVYGIIEQHGGWISVDSTLGKGTVFQIYLPAVEEHQHDGADQEDSTELYRGNGETILLIEDEESVRQVGREVLKRNGYRVLEAEDGAQARRIMHEIDEEPDLLVSDVVLPDVSGVELVSEFEEEYPGLRILLVSGYTADKANLDKIELRKYPFLQKPYTLIALLKKVKELIRSS
ncbi:MAG: response regulator [Candidatus Aegiribacteria sp.]|nr:response regulator [Candidatus Aegiribacteria sp.]MBD3295288.1 response regulator [Candidatus Fermentibacteria bacterium]